MNIAQLLNKLRIIAKVEIVVPLLPEMLRVPKQAPGYSLLQGFEGIGERVLLRPGGPLKPDFGLSGAVRRRGGPFKPDFGLSGAVRRRGGPFKPDFGLSGAVRFAEQEVNMLGHDYIAINVESVTTPHPCQG